MRFILHLFVSSIFFVFLLPHIPGAHFIGGMEEGLIYGVLMGFVTIILYLIIGLLTFASSGLLLVLGILITVLSKYLLPCLLAILQLHLLADWFPSNLTFETGSSVVLAGLAYFVVHHLTHAITA